MTPNRLIINIQPAMDIKLQFMTKKPGLSLSLRPSEMIFDYFACSTMSPEAYETLIADALAGDPTLFMRWDQVEQANFPNYKAGSWGPEEADELLARQGHAWIRNIQNNIKEEDVDDTDIQ